MYTAVCGNTGLYLYVYVIMSKLKKRKVVKGEETDEAMRTELKLKLRKLRKKTKNINKS